MRKLGKILNFDKNSSLQSVLNQKNLIRKQLAMNGVIVLRHLNFNPKKLKEMATQILGDPINLPQKYSFFKDPEFPQVQWVGNVKPRSEKVASEYRDAVGWHSDGEFWQQGTKLVINTLHAKQLPDQGGQTQFIDMVEGYNLIKTKQPEIIKQLQESQAIVQMKHIPFFLGVQEGEFNAKLKSYHPIIKKSLLNKYTRALHINYSGIRMKNGQQKLGIYSTGHPLDPVKLINMIVKYNGIYEHIYELGDIIIWDNTQVMHQSTGYFKGRRSILRIQTDLMRQAQQIRNLVQKQVYKLNQ